jgi:hypothetical protein
MNAFLFEFLATLAFFVARAVVASQNEVLKKIKIGLLDE